MYDVRKRALERFERAWNEALFRYGLRSKRSKVKLDKLARHKQTAARNLGETFSKLEGKNPCMECGRCCGKAAMDSGYYSHIEREALIKRGVNLRDYIVPSWQGEPPERCLFLSGAGCNVPTEYRSTNCLSYICHDKLGPRLVTLKLDKKILAKREKLTKIKHSLNKLGDVPFQREVNSLGEG